MATTKARGRRTGVTSSRSSVAVTISAGRSSLVVALGLVAGCALKGDVRKVELQVQSLRQDLAKSDSVRAAGRDSILAAVRLAQQALTAQQAYLVQLRGDVRTELTAVQQQLVGGSAVDRPKPQRVHELGN